MQKSRVEELTNANAAFRQAMKTVIQRARQFGTPIVIWEDGQIVHITPEEAEARLKNAPVPTFADESHSR